MWPQRAQRPERPAISSPNSNFAPQLGQENTLLDD